MSIHPNHMLMETVQEEQSSFFDAILSSPKLSPDEKKAFEKISYRVEKNIEFILQKLIFLPDSNPTFLNQLDTFLDDFMYLLDSPENPQLNATKLSLETQEKIMRVMVSVPNSDES